MPQVLSRAFWFLLGSAIIHVGVGLLYLAASGAGDLDSDLASAMNLAGTILLIAGVIQLVLTLAARRRNGVAAALLVAVSIGLAVFAVPDLLATFDGNGSIAVPTLRVLFNALGAVFVIMHRGWFAARSGS